MFTSGYNDALARSGIGGLLTTATAFGTLSRIWRITKFEIVTEM